jgi:nicotinamide-nucleotide amidase
MYNLDTINSIKRYLKQREQTLAVAESVTSGHLQAAFSLATGATEFFQGGITTYNLGQKVKHLGVDPIHAEPVNCVSDKISEQMALEVSKYFLSDWGIATTGYAAPVPELKISELFVIFSIVFRGEIMLTKRTKAYPKSSPFEAQLFFANTILEELNDVLVGDTSIKKISRLGQRQDI